MNKKQQLFILLNDTEPDIIEITKSWANTNISDAVLRINGYTVFWKDRVPQRGGGVILYYRNSIPVV